MNDEPKHPPHTHIDPRLWQGIPDPYGRRGWVGRVCVVCGKFIGTMPLDVATRQPNHVAR